MTPRGLADVQITLGEAQPGGPAHLIVDVAARRVLSCTGGTPTNPRQVAFDAVREQLECPRCRKFWTRLANTRSGVM